MANRVGIIGYGKMGRIRAEAVEPLSLMATLAVAVIGAGPIGQLAVRSARQQGHAERIIAVDLVDERLELARAWGAQTIDLREVDSVEDAIRDLTGGRGADSVLDAVGMEAHGNPVAEQVVKAVGKLPGGVGQKVMETAGVDRLSALHEAIDLVRRGGTISISGVYGGAASPMPGASYMVASMSAASCRSSGVMAATGLDEAPAAGRPWKMSLAPPRTLTRSVELNRPPAAV